MKSVQKQSALGKFLVNQYGLFRKRVFRRLILKLVYRREGGEFLSLTLREIFQKHHGVEIGKYTHGGCFVSGNYDRYTKIGRYCSIAMGSNAMNRNHPLEYKSMHAYFFNPKLGMCSEDNVGYIPLEIGSDVWIGHNAIIMPHVTSIGHGAVVGAGAVVNKDIPPYGVVVGNPGRIIRYRFSEERIQELLAEKWWEKDIDELKGSIEDFQTYANPSQNESE
jgi:acetyltransferase-like isoleucine patch superfamily enzyme